jgi:hypothetical protein
MGCSDQCRYSVVAGGDVTAKLTWRVMLFSSLFDFGTGCNFIVKQDNFNKREQNHLLENSRAINKLQDIVERTSNDVRMLVKHF